MDSDKVVVDSRRLQDLHRIHPLLETPRRDDGMKARLFPWTPRDPGAIDPKGGDVLLPCQRLGDAAETGPRLVTEPPIGFDIPDVYIADSSPTRPGASVFTRISRRGPLGRRSHLPLSLRFQGLTIGCGE